MKLKTLTIKNIASIEDATVCFSEGILERQDLFLITGPTGAGKTTILDAISLALFNTTPRIENASTDVIDEMADPENRMKVKNVLHLVRKNSVEASVTLTFDVDVINDMGDLESRECLASWRVYRVGQYRKGKQVSTFSALSREEKLKKATLTEWTFTDAFGKVYQRDGDVRAAIQKAIKMNFKQFCKTTMLAQGDFTKFLSSTSDEKAEILEKLAGTERYARTGAVINAKANEMSAKVERLQEDVAGIKPFTDAEKTERLDAISKYTDEVKALQKKQQEVNESIQMLVNQDKAVKAELASKAALDKAEEVLKSDEVMADKHRLELWDKTADLRKALEAKRACDSETPLNDKKRDALALQYDYARAALKQLSLSKEALDTESLRIKAFLDAQSRFSQMFDNAPIICNTHKSIVEGEKYIEESTPKLKELDEKLAALNDKKEAAMVSKAKAEAEIAEIDHNISALNAKLHDLGDSTINQEIKDLNSHKSLVNDAIVAFDTCNDLEQAKSEKDDILAKRKDEYENSQHHVHEKKAELERAEETLKSSKTLYEKAKESISDYAKVLREKLHVGDSCPICGSMIDHELSDEGFINALKPIEDRYKADDEQVHSLSQAYAQAKAQLDANSKLCNQAEKDVLTAKDKLDKANVKLRDKCTKLNIDFDSVAKEVLCELKSKDESVEGTLNQRQSAIDEIRKEINALTKKTSSIRKSEIDPIDKSINDIQSEYTKLSTQKNKIEGKVSKTKESVESDKAKLVPLINDEWKPTDERRYFEDLQQAANEYAECSNQYNRNTNLSESWLKELNLIANYKAEIDDMFADWISRPESEPQSADDTTLIWSSLSSDCKVLSNKIAENKQSRADAVDAIKRFVDNNADVDISEAEALLDVKSNDINDIRSQINKLNDALLKAKAKHDEDVRVKEELFATKVEDGVTLESLRALNDEVSSLINEKNQDIGRLDKELKDDEENLKAKGDKLRKLESLKVECAKWKTLDQYLGSSKGKRFRNVAQSFIFNDLLDRANEYLEDITDRYKLICNPGTLTVLVQDAYQGGAIRPFNTNSGGESFIISLSLALGLSSMQSNGFEVDTLFIDEGFGTLSPDYFDAVVASLKRLAQKYGRKVGIISHMDMLRQHIPAKIMVVRDGNSSSSKVEVTLS